MFVESLANIFRDHRVEDIFPFGRRLSEYIPAMYVNSHTLLAYTLANVSQTGKCPRFYDRKKYLSSFLQTYIKYGPNIF